MRGTQHFALVLALSTALVFHIKAQKPAITCAAGYHTPGMTATITCHFHGQISTDQNTGVYITRYKLGAPKDDSGKEVLMCHFSGGSVSVCNPEPGYRFINFNKNNLTIEVPDVSPEFQGRYSCGVVPADSRTVIPCLLVVKEDLEVPYNEAQSDPDASERHKELHARVQTTHNVTIVILIAIIMLVALATVIYALIAHKRNWLPFTLCRTQADVENTGQLPEPDRSGTMTVAYKPVRQATREDDHPYKNEKAPPPEPPSNSSNEGEPMIPALHKQSDNTGIEEKADEKKIETKEERIARYEKEDKERKDKLEEDLRNATSEKEKQRLQKKFDDNGKKLNQQRKKEEEKEKKEEKEREKKEEKERLKREKKEKKGKK